MSVLTLRKRIIYDTHGANIYINICTTKIFIEKVKMTINYQEEIKFISNKIRELRKEKQMTVQELAYRCDMERSNMSRIESGRTNLTVKTMCIICNALSSVKANKYLYYIKPDPTQPTARERRCFLKSFTKYHIFHDSGAPIEKSVFSIVRISSVSLREIPFEQTPKTDGWSG